MIFENLMALYIAINNQCPPEIAFKRLDRLCGEKIKNFRFPWTDEDLQDIGVLKMEGLSWREIATYYGVAESTVCAVYLNYIKKSSYKKEPKIKKLKSILLQNEKKIKWRIKQC
jgi:hypothetical protein